MGETMIGCSFLPVIGSDITSSDGPSASIQYQYSTSTSPVSSRYVQLPLFGVISHFSFCKPELQSLFGGKNALCDYLVDSTLGFMKKKFPYEHWSKPLWDICVAAWAVNPDFFLDRITAAPVPQYDETYAFLPDTPPLRYVYYVYKDALVGDMLRKPMLPGAGSGELS